MTKKNLTIIILAAGKGTRMQSNLSKVLHPICNKPMIWHVLDTAKSLKPQQIITVLSPNMNEVAHEISNTSKVVIQQQQLGTADAIKPALKYVTKTNNILILFADTPLLTSKTLTNTVKSLNNNDITILGFRPDDPAEYGRLIINNQNKQVEKIVEFKDANKSEKSISLCNSGVIATHGSLLLSLIDKIDNNNTKGEFYLTDLIALATKQNKKCSFVEANSTEVLGINNRTQLAQAEHIAQQNLRNQAMLTGTTLIDPSSVYFSHDTKIGQDVTIEPNVTFGPKVIIHNNVTIKSFCHIEHATIQKNVSIGPFARIRPHTQINEGAHIGNFVEIKKSTIGPNAKISHLSYIGDAEIGSQTNIGAGTITCNYDGKNKHKTTIQESVFIGSNTALIAPIKIGKNSVIGAGSVITKDVKANALAVSRNQQITKENWKKEKNNH